MFVFFFSLSSPTPSLFLSLSAYAHFPVGRFQSFCKVLKDSASKKHLLKNQMNRKQNLF